MACKHVARVEVVAQSMAVAPAPTRIIPRIETVVVFRIGARPATKRERLVRVAIARSRFRQAPIIMTVVGVATPQSIAFLLPALVVARIRVARIKIHDALRTSESALVASDR
jgi:hypothetical protein